MRTQLHMVADVQVRTNRLISINRCRHSNTEVKIRGINIQVTLKLGNASIRRRAVVRTLHLLERSILLRTLGEPERRRSMQIEPIHLGEANSHLDLAHHPDCRAVSSSTAIVRTLVVRRQINRGVHERALERTETVVETTMPIWARKFRTRRQIQVEVLLEIQTVRKTLAAVRWVEASRAVTIHPLSSKNTDISSVVILVCHLKRNFLTFFGRSWRAWKIHVLEVTE